MDSRCASHRLGWASGLLAHVDSMSSTWTARAICAIEALRLQVDLTVKSLFDRSLSANAIVISIPVPPQTAKVAIKKSKGEAKYDGAAGVIRWTIVKFSGQKEHSLSADVVLVSTTREKKPWSRCGGCACVLFAESAHLHLGVTLDAVTQCTHWWLRFNARYSASAARGQMRSCTICT
jgi:Adaptor complexes medium subunit family